MRQVLVLLLLATTLLSERAVSAVLAAMPTLALLEAPLPATVTLSENPVPATRIPVTLLFAVTLLRTPGDDRRSVGWTGDSG